MTFVLFSSCSIGGHILLNKVEPINSRISLISRVLVFFLIFSRRLVSIASSNVNTNIKTIKMTDMVFTKNDCQKTSIRPHLKRKEEKKTVNYAC